MPIFEVQYEIYCIIMQIIMIMIVMIMIIMMMIIIQPSIARTLNDNDNNTVKLQLLEHCWLVYHGCFELVLESLGQNPIAADLG